VAMFCRRTLRRLLDENSQFLPETHTRRLEEELDRACDPSTPDRNKTLSWEWEVVLLNVFGKIGKVKYHEKLDGPKKADLHFESVENPSLSFLADITTLSDKSLQEHNPINFLRQELSQIVQGYGLNPNRFSVHPEGEYYYSGREGTKVRLFLPGRARFRSTIFTKKFEEFLQSISQSLDHPRTYEVNQTDIKVKIGYDPNQPYASAGYLIYSVVFSLNRNVIYEHLEPKRKQLRETGFKGPMGIFLCDGDCSLLQESGIRKSSGSYTRDHIIQHFLSEDPLISFIVVFPIEEENPQRPLLRAGPRRFRVSTQLYKGPGFDDRGGIVKVLEKAKMLFPQPERDTCNAMHLLRGRYSQQGSSFFGGHQVKMGEKTSDIKVSAREVLDLLAGNLSYGDFLKRHGFDKTVNPFWAALNKGQLIQEISMEKSNFEDDDWIVFKLNGPDPAISKFRETSALGRKQEKKG
jgi:hypothetical protein